MTMTAKDNNQATFRDLMGRSARPAAADVPRRRPRRPVPRPTAKDYSRNPPQFQIIERPPAKFSRGGVNRASLRKFEKGALLPMEKLDLHGFVRDQAVIELEHRLRQCAENNVRCLLVVVGIGRFSKGLPVLKPHILSYLMQHSGVLAYAPAKNSDGGGGAVYVMLRR
ncbi:MAG: Smr/MutS family protein [Gammaproteobacteria bacterium]|nr:Smr/MutS family protein [Gammaproteobacteria bacterium]MDD9885730.1 Smr/MutS family protein [Gammaproteobacteria bacterium]